MKLIDVKNRVQELSDRWERVSSWVSYDALYSKMRRLEDSASDPDRCMELDGILYDYSTVTSDMCIHFDIISGLEKDGAEDTPVPDEMIEELDENEKVIAEWESKYLK